MGPSRVFELMAWKRPKLIPMFGYVLASTVFARTSKHWLELGTRLRDSGSALHQRLMQIREAAELDASVSVLRVFDVCAWMDGTTNGVAVAGLARL
jgi:hypothetical protein